MSDSRRKIFILDTTLRDGEQTQGVSFAPAEKLNIAKALLGQLKVDRIEVASARVSEGEKEAVAAIVEWAEEAGLVDRVEVLGFVDHKKSVDWIVDTGCRVINLLTKGSEKHCRGQLNKSLERHLEDIHRTIDYAVESGLRVNIYLEDWSNGYRDSRDYVFALMDGLRNAPISHFMLPDTLGVLTPGQVRESLTDMRSSYPWAEFDFHPHNDYGLATANSVTAIDVGISSIHCTINCLGERAGNASLAEVVVNLKDQMGLELDIDESHIVRLSQMVENFSGKRIAANAPIVGDDVFTQTSGIHADGDNKGGLYQTALTPERFARQRSYALGKMSGKASLQKNLEKLDISLSNEDVSKVLKKVVALGDSKESITSDDLPFIITEVLESRGYNLVELLDCSVSSGLKQESTASIVLRVGGEAYPADGVGNGGFAAFVSAVKTVLVKLDIQMPRLIDYEVRIPRGGKVDALTECTITWSDGESSLRTRGVHSNQVFAAMNATIRMLNIQLHNLGMDGA